MPSPQDTNGSAQATVFDNLGIDAAEFEVGGDDLGLDGGQQDQQGQPGQQGGIDNLDAPQGQQGQQGHLPRGAEVKPDRQGNLRTPDGKLVARAGAEARRYQELHNTRQRLSQTETTTRDLASKLNHAVSVGRDLHQRLTALQGQQETIKQFGLEPQEHIRALELYSMLKKDPENALKTLLTRAATHGINLGNITGSGNVDPKSLMDLVRETIGKEMNPLRETMAAEQKRKAEEGRMAEVNRQATEEVNSFFGQNQEAAQYLPVFQAVLSQPQFSKMSLGEIWARIQLQLALNPPAGGANGRTGSRPRSIPSGRASPANAQQGGEELAPVNSSYDKILNEVLDQAGYQR